MPADVLNFGSLNIDHVYRVPHFVMPGETLSASSYIRNAGGKGLNQSIALARAGVAAAHAGKIGPDGMFLVDVLQEAGVDVSGILSDGTATGHACIQVEDSGQNSILLYPGANREISGEEVCRILDMFSPRWLLLQNETSQVPLMIREAAQRNIAVAINPAPCGPEVAEYPLELAALLFVNEIESAQLAGKDGTPDELADILTRRYPETAVVMTLGADGALYACGKDRIRIPACPAKAVDTTSAGDTFNGYFLASLLRDIPVENALKLAAQAAAITVSRPGAASSIPRFSEVAGI